MLRKTPGSRPTLSRVELLLVEIVEQASCIERCRPVRSVGGSGAQVADHEQRLEAQREAVQKAREVRNQLARTGFEILSENVERLWAKIHLSVAVAERVSGPEFGAFGVRVGEAALSIGTAAVP